MKYINGQNVILKTQVISMDLIKENGDSRQVCHIYIWNGGKKKVNQDIITNNERKIRWPFIAPRPLIDIEVYEAKYHNKLKMSV
jgi:hypothetical protein